MSDSPVDEKPLAHLDNALNELKRQAEVELRKQDNKRIHFTTKPAKSFSELLREQRARKEQIANDIREKDQELKVSTLKKLFLLLSAETGIIFVLAFFQGFKSWGFNLDEWSFRLVVAATLGQITAMLTIAVQHLFPKK